MPVDENFINSSIVWIKRQCLAIEQLADSNAYNAKEITLHEKTIRLNNETIAHYEAGVKSVQEMINNHIKENS